METKKGLNGEKTVQPGNYRKGPWDSVSEVALNTEASHSIADSNLRQFDETDDQMDQHQEVGYTFVRWIAERTPDAESRRAARQALHAFNQAEVWESLNEQNVVDGHGAVRRARHSNHGVIGMAEAHRKAAAQAQRDGMDCTCGTAA